MAFKGDAVREKILELLQEKTDGYTSGEEISQLFSISRAAVSKHVAVLRGQGHEIEAVAIGGECLVVVSIQKVTPSVVVDLEVLRILVEIDVVKGHGGSQVETFLVQGAETEGESIIDA